MYSLQLRNLPLVPRGGGVCVVHENSLTKSDRMLIFYKKMLHGLFFKKMHKTRGCFFILVSISGL